jgi:hypothetical protein
VPVAGAVVGAVGSVAGGISSGKGASKAAKIAAQSAAQQQALLKSIYDQNSANFQSDISNGNTAATRINQLLGLSPGGPSPTEILRNTPGYQFKLDQGLKAVNSNAYASGLGNSGATLKALLATGQGIADQGFNNYINQVGTVDDRGIAAKGALAGVSTNYANNSNAVTQTNSDAQAANAVFQGNNLSNVLKGLSGAGGSAFGSSYGAPKSAGGTPSLADVMKVLTASGGSF